MRIKIIKIILIIIFITNGKFIFPQMIRYVSTNGTTTSLNASDATTWESSCNDLQAVINISQSGDEIWVKYGTYKPTHSSNNWTEVLPTIVNSNLSDKENSFVLKSGIKIFGGFLGTENNLSERILNENFSSTLSGDIDNDNSLNNNSYHVVISVWNNSATTLDGFTITGGNASSSASLSVNGESIYKNSGAGITTNNSSSIFSNITIHNNYASNSGGGISNSTNSNITLINSIISGNYASSGGGIFNNSSSPEIINVTITGNLATITNGGGMQNVSTSNPNIYNSIIWGNFLPNINNISGSVPNYFNSLIRGIDLTSYLGLDGTNINNEPQFYENILSTDAPCSQGNFKLKITSPCINIGENNYNSTAYDITNSPRIKNGTIDLGAYEMLVPIPNSEGILFVKEGGEGLADGSSWENAYPNLADPLLVAITNLDIEQIWVSTGTYYPEYIAGTGISEREKAFVLAPNVKIYGGFTGTENAPEDRNLTGNNMYNISNTILSGNIGIIDNNSDNCFHVVISSDDVGTACLNGFTISGGNANLTTSILLNGYTIFNNYGAGISNIHSSPTFENLIITNNNSVCATGIDNDYSNSIFKNLIIQNNIAAEYGGGISNENSQIEFINTLLSSNFATDKGGAIYNKTSIVSFTNNTIVKNSATNGGGLYNLSSSTSFNNSVIWGNTTNNVNLSGGNVTYSYSLLENSNPPGIGNLNGLAISPMFIDFANDNFQISGCSPLVNAGNNQNYLTACDIPLFINENDILGNPRLINTIIDIGAFESALTPPNVSIHANQNICMGDSLALFTFTGTAPWSVTYNDGTSNQTISNILNSPYYYTFNTAGISQFTLISVSDNSCINNSISGNCEITTISLPNVTLATSQNLCQNDSLILFNFSGTQPWTFTYSINSINQTISNYNENNYYFSATNAGIYDIKLIEISDNNCSNLFDDSTKITVKYIPNLSIANSQNICSNENLELFVFSGEQPWTITYNDGNENQTISNYSENTYYFTENQNGLYIFNIISISDNYCTNDTISANTTITVNPLPNILVANSQSLCSGEDLPLFTFTGTQPWTITYNDGTSNQTISNITTNPYIFNETISGNYTFNIISITDNNCINNNISVNTTITVKPLPAVDILSNSQNVCLGDSIGLFIFSGNSPWTLDYYDGTSSTLKTISNITSNPYFFTPNEINNYYFNLSKITDACTSINISGTTAIYVNPLPDIYLASPQLIFLGNSVELFTLSGTQPWTINYTLDGNNENLQTTNSSYFFTPTECKIYNFNITSITDNYCTKNLDLSTTITVQDTTLLQFDNYVVTKWDNIFILNLRKLEDDNLLPINCKWYENDILIGIGMSYSKGNNKVNKFIEGAIYRFDIETNSGTRISTEKIYILENSNLIKIFPNPISENQILTIEYSEKISNDETIEIYDELGKMISIKMNTNKISIPNNFKSGTYIIKIKDNITKLIVR
ncbi:MAG: hypothetical protein LBV69_07645 [Bacteroidales bacterium]|jgi:hypothetical protein|nr:hypothetical protein [Bacteroidales bacterium]